MDSNEKMLRKSIGKKIKLARSRTEYTQEKLAEKLSLSARYISQLERGVAFGSATTIVNLCKALNINSNFLFDDIIKNDSPTLKDVINEDFLEDFMKLNNYNKEVITGMTKQLLRIQKTNSYKNAN